MLIAALTFVLGLGVVATVPAPAAPPSDQATIAKLIEQLGSNEFEQREKAQKELDAIGAPALEALRKAADGHSQTEVRMRAGVLVRTIEMRTVSNTVLAPRKIHLVYKDTPLPEAVADFSKKTGYAITLQDPEAVKDRKITLDTGEVPFWEAFDQFCSKAGLVEVGANQVGPIRRGPIRRGPGGIQPLPPQQIQPGLQGQAWQAVPQAFVAQVQVQIQAQPAQAQPAQAQPAQIQVQIQPVPLNGPNAGPVVGPVGGPVGADPGPIVLADGAPKALPTDASGPVRIRALDTHDLFGAPPPNEYLITLQATPEPRLRLMNLHSVVITRAIDDQNQALMQTTGEVDPNQPQGQPNVQPGVRPVRGGPARMPRIVEVRDHYLPVHLKKGLKASTSLKELTGVISAEVVSEPKVVLSADDILRSAGKTFKGADGYIKVLEVSKAGDDQITIRIEMQQPKDLIPVQGGTPQIDVQPVPIQPGPRRGGPQPLQPGGQQFQAQIAQPGQGGIGQPGQGGNQGLIARPVAAGNGLTLLDEKGNALPQVGAARTMASRNDGKGGVIVEQVLTFQTKGMGVPSKLVLSGSHSATVNIPFTLKNVPLN
jgi:hypothetical protein